MTDRQTKNNVALNLFQGRKVVSGCDSAKMGHLSQKQVFIKSRLASSERLASFAFTLAEVLITLGIIGVVAALTIPNLMKNIQDKQFKEAAKKAYSSAYSAVEQIKQDEGGSLTYYIQHNASFKPVLMTYFKIIKDYDNNGYTPITPAAVAPDIYLALSGALQAAPYYVNDGQFVTVDGVFWAISNNSSFPILITVDVNGTKKPNTYGQDTFMFQIVNDKLLPMGAAGTNYSSDTKCNRAVNWDSRQGFGCMALVMQGIDY